MTVFDYREQCLVWLVDIWMDNRQRNNIFDRYVINKDKIYKFYKIISPFCIFKKTFWRDNYLNSKILLMYNAYIFMCMVNDATSFGF